MDFQKWLRELGDLKKEWLSKIDPDVVNDCMVYALERAMQMLIDENLSESNELTNFVLNHSWQHLHTGHWSQVHVSWRLLYTFASTIHTLALCALQKPQQALRCCDNGLVMGAPFQQNLLALMAQDIHDHLPALHIRQQQSIEVNVDSTKVLTQFCHGIGNRTTLKRVHCPSLEEFSRDYLSADKPMPVLINGALDSWPAIGKWNVEYLIRVAGYRTVPVEIGSKYTAEDWTQKLITIKELVEKYFDKNVGYLAQHDLFSQISKLKDDIGVPEYCCLLCPADEVDINGWFGPKGTVSPLHTDPKHNLFAQIIGAKYICLCPPWQSECVYPIEEGMMTNTSQVDMVDPDLKQFPKLGNVHVYEAVVNAGDLLFIPKGWWHYVKSLSISFSASFWFQSSDDLTASESS